MLAVYSEFGRNGLDLCQQLWIEDAVRHIIMTFVVDD